MPLRPPGHALLSRPWLQACRTPLPPGNPPDPRPVPSPAGCRLQGQPKVVKQTAFGSDRRLPGRTVIEDPLNPPIGGGVNGERMSETYIGLLRPLRLL